MLQEFAHEYHLFNIILYDKPYADLLYRVL